VKEIITNAVKISDSGAENQSDIATGVASLLACSRGASWKAALKSGKTAATNINELPDA
jgi:hypothetical protein